MEVNRVKIKELRVAAGLKQVDLAKAMNVSQSTVAGWETGECYPSAQRIPALAKALGVKIQELFVSDETA